MRTIGGALALIAMLGGCSGTIFKKYDIDETSLALDARQRTVISAPRPAVDEQGRRPVVCAEPSPDAVSALASSTEGSLSLAEFLGLSGSAKAIELVVACLVMIDRSGVRQPPTGPQVGLQEACTKIVGATPVYLEKVLKNSNDKAAAEASQPKASGDQIASR